MRFKPVNIDENPISQRVNLPRQSLLGARNLGEMAVIQAVAMVGCLLFTPALFAADSAADCTEIDLRYEKFDAPLTDAEIAELRARRHNASLNAFERCVNAAVGGGGGGGGAGGGGAGQGVGVAAQGIQGSDASVVQPPPADRTEPIETSESDQDQPTTLANGRAPQDIPSADNDSVLAAQIRRAAETETNPERQAKLWNEYRKIRGLPLLKTDA